MLKRIETLPSGLKGNACAKGAFMCKSFDFSMLSCEGPKLLLRAKAMQTNIGLQTLIISNQSCPISNPIGGVT